MSVGRSVDPSIVASQTVPNGRCRSGCSVDPLLGTARHGTVSAPGWAPISHSRRAGACRVLIGAILKQAEREGCAACGPQSPRLACLVTTSRTVTDRQPPHGRGGGGISQDPKGPTLGQALPVCWRRFAVTRLELETLDDGPPPLIASGASDLRGRSHCCACSTVI